MLRKIVVLIGSMLVASMALAEDAPLPFDDPAAAPPIVRKAAPSKAVVAPVATSSKGKTATVSKRKNTPSARKTSKTKAPAMKSKSSSGTKKTAVTTVKTSSASKKSKPVKTSAPSKKRSR